MIVLLSLQHLVNFVTHLLPATMTMTIAAAAIVLRTSQFHVSLTQPLGLDSGTQHFALQKAVAVTVSGEKLF